MLNGPDGLALLPWLATPLAQALAQQRAHALLLHAAPGDGALSFALALAQGWLCEAAPVAVATATATATANANANANANATTNANGAATGAGGVGGGKANAAVARPGCGRCTACRLLQSRTHPDLLVLLPEALRESLGWAAPAEDASAEGGKAKRKPSRQIRIDELRAATDWIVRTSSRGRAKVVVLHPAEALNAHAAGALLKTLEEPPRGARLVLSCARPELLLPTVRSRCQCLVLPPPTAAQAREWLAAQGVQGADVMLAAAGGRPLDALAWVAEGIDAAAWRALPGLVAARGRTPPIAGWPVARVVDALQKLCHDAMVQAVGGRPRFYPAVPAGARLPALVAWSQRLGRTARHAEHAWNEPLLTEALVAQGRRAWQPAATDADADAEVGAGAGVDEPAFDTLEP